MDNWPGWKMVPKTADERTAEHEKRSQEIQEVRWNPALGWGLGTGVVAGVIAYFITIGLLPVFYKAIDVIK